MRRRTSQALGRLFTGGGHIVQKAVAAGAAWWLATVLLGHERPAFAAIAAIISLGAAAGKEGKQAVELIFGVACGLAVADLLVSTLGVGVVQIGLVVALATALALLLGEGKLLINEAAISALLMIIIAPSASGMSARFLDALIGSGTALAVWVIFPHNPRYMVRRTARSAFDGLIYALEEIAHALHKGDPDHAEYALQKAREQDVWIKDLGEAVDAGYRTARISPPGRYALGRLALYATAAEQLDLAIRNIRVLARATTTMIRSGQPTPGDLVETVLDLSRAVEALIAYVEEPDHPLDTRYFSLRAAAGATAVLGERNDLDTNVLVGQIRSTAIDLLRASGMSESEALEALQEAPETGGFLPVETVPPAVETEEGG